MVFQTIPRASRVGALPHLTLGQTLLCTELRRLIVTKARTGSFMHAISTDCITSWVLHLNPKQLNVDFLMWTPA
jgi:hypothetical protein